MCAKRKSVIWDAVMSVDGFLGQILSKSCILKSLFGCFSALELRFTASETVGLASRLSDRARRAWMRGFEGSFFFKIAYSVGVECLRTSVGTWGCFALLYSCFSGALLFATGGLDFGMLAALAGLAALFFPALHVSQSLGDSLRKSALLGWFFFDFCGLEWNRFSIEREGKGHPWIALASAAVLGSLVRFFSPILCFLLLLGIACFALLLAVPPLSICLFLVALPFFNLLPHPTMILLFSVGMLYAVWLRRALCGRCYVRFCLLDFLVLLLVLAYLLSGFGGYGGISSVASGFTVAAVVSVWFPTVSLLHNAVWRRRAAGSLGISCTVCAFWGCLQYFLGKAELRWVDMTRFSDIGGRVTSVFGNPNVLSVLLLFGLPFLPVVFCVCRCRASVRFFGVICLIVTSLCLLLTWTRGAWLGALLSCLLLLLLYGKETRGAFLLALFPLGCALPFLPHNIKNRFASIGSLTESSIRYRLYTWRGVLRLLKAEPWGIGTGAQAFTTAYRRYAVSGTETVIHAHDLFLRVACDIGVMGLALFLLLLILLLFYDIGSRHQAESPTRRKEIGTACFCALCGVLLMGIFDDVWYHNGLAALFWVISGMMTAEYERVEYGNA